jgi:hypothetical protein
MWLSALFVVVYDQALAPVAERSFHVPLMMRSFSASLRPCGSLARLRPLGARLAPFYASSDCSVCCEISGANRLPPH